MFTSPLVRSAHLFASAAHTAVDQRRKYTNEPYINHPIEVARILIEHGVTDEILLAAALLHDVVEDTCVTIELVEEFFGSVISNLVRELTDVSRPQDGPRRVRKALDREHASKSSQGARIVKLADCISNAQSIGEHDPKFARVFLEEVELLRTEVLATAHADLNDSLVKILSSWKF